MRDRSHPMPKGCHSASTRLGDVHSCGPGTPFIAQSWENKGCHSHVGLFGDTLENFCPVVLSGEETDGDKLQTTEVLHLICTPLRSSTCGCCTGSATALDGCLAPTEGSPQEGDASLTASPVLRTPDGL